MVNFCAEDGCTLSVTTRKSISCDVCNECFCPKCMGIDAKHCEVVNSSKNIKMVCNKCLKLHFKELCKFKKIEERFEILGKKLEEKIDEKLKAIPEIEKKLVQLPKEMKDSYAIALAGKQTDPTDTKDFNVIVRDALHKNKQAEKEEDEDERSVIITGVEESDKKDYDERQNMETDKIKSIIEKGIKITTPKIVSVTRLGSFNRERKRSRLVKVSFEDKHKRNRVIRNASNLKMAGQEYKNCYITKARSAIEREEHKLQLQKAKEKNEEEGNEDTFYVVRGYPTKWEIVGIPKRK